jgi:hypothetical protein
LIIILVLGFFIAGAQYGDESEIERLRRENSQLWEKIKAMKKEREGMADFMKRYTTIVSEVRDGLESIDRGLVNYGRAEIPRKYDIKEDLLDTISRIRQRLEQYQNLAEELKLSKEEVENYKTFVAQLKKVLERKEQEVIELTRTIIALEKNNLELEKKNYALTKKYDSQILDFVNAVDKLKTQIDNKKKEANRKYVIEVTPKILLYKECTYEENLIKMKGKKVKLLSSHPDNSYKLLKKGRNYYELEIFDWEEFWGMKKFLVIFHK